MTQKMQLLLLLLVALLLAEEKKVSLTHTFQVTAKAEKDLYDNEKTDNIDNFFGRVGYGLSAKGGKRFSGAVTILAYPAGFGYELLRGIETVEDSLAVSQTKIAKFQVDAAYVTHHGKYFNITLGRLCLFNSPASFYGNYTDEGPGGYFNGKGVAANVLSWHSEYKQGKTEVLLGTNDPNINEGYFRFYQSLKLGTTLNLGVGFRSNFPDKVHKGSADVLWNSSLALDYTLKDKVTLYSEIGFVDISEHEEVKIPILVGVRFPIKKALDKVVLEAEILKEEDRPVIDAVQQSPVLLGLHLEKQLNTYFKLQLGLYTQREISEPGIGIRVDASI